VALAAGAQVSLTAAADPGGTFLGWSGDCAGTQSCTLVMDRDRQVHASFERPPDGGFPRDGGTGNPDAGVPPHDGGSPPDAGTLFIQILSPAPSTMVTGASFDVLAQIQTAGAALDETKLEALLQGYPAMRLLPNAGGPAETYRGTIPVATLRSARYDLVVRAASLDGATSSKTQPVLVNTGPLIAILRPESNGRASQLLSYDFTVRIAPDIAGVTVASVTAAVGQCAVTLPAPTVSENVQRYTGSHDLDTCSPPLVDGTQQLTVTARDDTQPTGIASTATALFVVDRRGPTINIRAPAAGQLVGGTITVEAEVTDPSGVRAGSVAATVSHGGTGLTFALEPATGNLYRGPFDTRRLPNPTRIQNPSLQVVADDSLGNHSQAGNLFSLDNVPPIGDIDPPRAQVVEVRQNQPNRCSKPFDPVGEVPNDLGTVLQMFDLRAQVRDEGNEGLGADYIVVSKVAWVTLYVLDDTSRPLVVDSDGDGFCDSINPQVVPTPGVPPGPTQALSLNMAKMPLRGGLSFKGPYELFDPGQCSAGTETSEPGLLCSTTTMAVTLQEYSYADSLIWTLPPVVLNDFQCAGMQFDALANNISDGWICVAVAFADGVGNRSVSRPIRLCVDKDGTGICQQDGGPGAAPSCTGTLNPATGEVSATPCTAYDFGARQLFLWRH
jgi:hypothetical protein